MKALITASGQFGPFSHIETLADRYRCDGVDYQFDVIGAASIGGYVAPPVVPTLAEHKDKSAQAVEAIKVTTPAGQNFDGDETSQGRMARAIVVLGSGTTPWVLADNTVAQVTAAELTEALALAGAEQARLWVQPYQE